MSCNNCNQTCCCQQQSGTQGPPGPQGPVGPAGPIGPEGAGGGVAVAFNFFEEYVDNQPMTNAVFYHPPGYEILSWTNNTGAPITLVAHATGQSVRGIPQGGTPQAEVDDIENDVEMAIIKTVGAVDSYTYIHHMRFDLRGGMFDAPYVSPNAGVPLTIASPLAPRQLTTDQSNPTEFRFAQSVLSQAAPIMKKITLNNGETVSLKFRSKGSGSILQSAQLFLQELSQ